MRFLGQYLAAVMGIMLAGLGLFAPAGAAASPLTRASAQVDLHGVPAIAAHVRRTLPGRLAVELYNRPVRGYPPGSRLVVRVVEVYLSHDGGEPFPRFGGGFGAFMMPDSIRGEVVVVDSRGQAIERKPITAHSPRSGGISPYNEPNRVQSLIDSLAYWAVHQVGR
jgi:hypothetical protein